MTIEYIGIAAEYYIKFIGKRAVATYVKTEPTRGHHEVNYYEIHKEIPGVAEIEKTRKPNPSLLKEVGEYFKNIDLYNN